MEPHLIEDCPSWTVPGTDWVVQGYSRSANKTGFAIFSLRLMFDAGVPTKKNVGAVLLTHSHADHSFQIPCIAMGHRNPCSVYCPVEMVEPLRLMCRASQSLNDCTTLLTDDQVVACGVSPGDIFEHCVKKNKVFVRVVPCYHEVPSVGYELSQETQRLKPEFQGLEGSKLAALKKNGVSITEMVRQKRMTFLGDTTIDVFSDTSILEDLPVLFIECTFVNDIVSPEEAKRRGHVHWRDLRPVVESHPHTTFVLIHFSKRYDAKFLEETFAPFENVYPWV